MKVGDKVYCIKNRFNIGSELVNKSGKEYVIEKIEKGHNTKIFLGSELGPNYYYYVLNDDGQCYYYEKYFISLKKLRKLKMKKINENR